MSLISERLLTRFIFPPVLEIFYVLISIFKLIAYNPYKIYNNFAHNVSQHESVRDLIKLRFFFFFKFTMPRLFLAFLKGSTNVHI